jgi:hypothetical protein
MHMHINISAGKANYSQRNNEVDPMNSCNVTSMVMALDYLGYEFPAGPHEQPEDNLHTFLTDHELRPTVHAELSQGVNMWMGKLVTNFATNRPIMSLFDELRNDRPVVISGDFPGYPRVLAKPLGHIVVLVGADFDDAGNITQVIIDDPYGDTMNNWQGSGNDVVLPWGLFLSWIKYVGDPVKKWGHFFKKTIGGIN